MSNDLYPTYQAAKITQWQHMGVFNLEAQLQQAT